jgi:hypothetical protein
LNALVPDAPAAPEVAATPTGVAAVPPEKRKVIRQGSAGAEVEYAQERLNAHGATPALAVDGLFGPKTRAATVEYQNSHALSPDAIIGPKTWGSLDGPVAVGKAEGGGGGAGGGRRGRRQGADVRHRGHDGHPARGGHEKGDGSEERRGQTTGR